MLLAPQWATAETTATPSLQRQTGSNAERLRGDDLLTTSPSRHLLSTGHSCGPYRAVISSKRVSHWTLETTKRLAFETSIAKDHLRLLLESVLFQHSDGRHVPEQTCTVEFGKPKVLVGVPKHQIHGAAPHADTMERNGNPVIDTSRSGLLVNLVDRNDTTKIIIALDRKNLSKPSFDLWIDHVIPSRRAIVWIGVRNQTCRRDNGIRRMTLNEWQVRSRYGLNADHELNMVREVESVNHAARADCLSTTSTPPSPETLNQTGRY